VTSRWPNKFTEREYLALERASDTKHELVDGAIVAMAGARPPHNMLTANMTAALVVLARNRRCATMTSDQRVHVPATGLYAYPDVVVACGTRALLAAPRLARRGHVRLDGG
jgi:Uma2 family endonuclease